jgi:hypothetical protein
MRDAVIDVDVSTPATRGFFGIQFRVAGDGRSAEWVYLRQHKSGLADAMQYTPVLGTGLNWQLYSGPGFTGAVDIPKDTWFHLRLEVTGAQAKLFVKDMEKPALVMDDLKSGLQRGSSRWRSSSARPTSRTSDPPHGRRDLGAAPARHAAHGVDPVEHLTRVRRARRDLERPLSASEDGLDRLAGRRGGAAGAGDAVPLSRRSPPARHASRATSPPGLDPQPGMKVLYARTTILSDKAEVKRLALGYSDDVSVFLNGKILYRGRSAQAFRDPGFLGIVSADDDAVYLPLKKGKNELVLALSELGGGWGFLCRLEPVGQAPRTAQAPVGAGTPSARKASCLSAEPERGGRSARWGSPPGWRGSRAARARRRRR